MATLPGINLGGNTSAQSAQFAQPIFSNQQYRSALGQSTANLSNTLGIPHIGVSDWIAGHPVTPTTGKASADYVSPVPNTGPNPPQNNIQAQAQSDRTAAYRASGGQGDVPIGFGGFESGGAPSQDQLFSDVNNAYNDVYAGLDQQQSQLYGTQQDLYDSFTKPYDAQQPLLTQARDQGIQVNQQQVSDTNQQSANAIAAARRLYQELTQGAQQRFGGSNSAGEFANAFFGRQYQQNQGGIQQTTGQNMSKLSDAHGEILSNYQTQLQTLEEKKQGALSQAKDVFNQRLSAIQSARGVADQNKAQLKLQALQELRTNAQNIQNQAIQFQQSLQSTVAQSAAQLAANVQAYKAQSGQAVDTNAIPNAVYSQFGGGQSQPGGVAQAFGSVGGNSNNDYLKQLRGY